MRLFFGRPFTGSFGDGRSLLSARCGTRSRHGLRLPLARSFAELLRRDNGGVKRFGALLLLLFDQEKGECGDENVEDDGEKERPLQSYLFYHAATVRHMARICLKALTYVARPRLPVSFLSHNRMARSWISGFR